MNQTRNLLTRFILFGVILLAACQANVDPTPQSNSGTLEESGPKVLAVESFLADSGS